MNFKKTDIKHSAKMNVFLIFLRLMEIYSGSYQGSRLGEVDIKIDLVKIKK